MARGIKRPILRASFFSTYCRGSKFLTSAAIRQANSAASNPLRGAMPLFPASSPRQTSSALLPTPQISPTPVTTTRRAKLISFRVGVDVVDRVFHGANLLGLLVGDLNSESLFKRHDQLDRVERVGAKVVHKRRIGSDFTLVHAQLLYDDLFYAFFYRCHKRWQLLLASPSQPANCAATLQVATG